jgi:protein-disulfide isomerase-like protein with CxxC motif
MAGQDLQLPLISALFKAFSEDDKDIGDLNVLAEISESVGMMTSEEARNGPITTAGVYLALLFLGHAVLKIRRAKGRCV